MAPFKWSPSNDVMLAKEVTGNRPDVAADCDNVASTLSAAFSTDEKKVEITGRACRERLKRLLIKYNEDDKKSLKK